LQRTQYFNFHILGVFNGFYRTEQIEREALAVPGVTVAESWGFDTVRRVRPNDTESDSIVMYAVPADTRMIIPTVLEGRWLLPNDENALVINSSVLGLEPDVKVGDTVTLKIDRRETEWKVVGIVRGIGGQAMVYTNYPYFARMRGFTGRAVAVTVQVDPADAANQERVAKELEAHYKSVGYAQAQCRQLRSSGSRTNSSSTSWLHFCWLWRCYWQPSAGWA